jgi:erythronate-4-phosphate dehydrogenase
VQLTILADENIPALEQYFGSQFTLTRACGRTLGPEQLREVDVLLVRSVTRVDAALLADSPVRFVGTATSGIDHIDCEYLAQRNIDFAHAPGANANSVVEYVLAAIAAVGDKLEQLMAGGTVGIVGYGHVGKALAARLAALGIRYGVSDPWLDQATVPNAAGLSTVLGSDVVCLHAELTTKQPWPSYHLLASAELAYLRGDALLINACRGPVVDNAALLALLQENSRLQVVLDVWEREPHVDAALLRRVALGSAHIAGYSYDGKILATRMLSEAVHRSLHIDLPRAAAAGDKPPVITIPAGVSGVGLLRTLVQSRYTIKEDDRQLRQAVFGSDSVEGAARQFDQLRKQYPVRRELAGSEVAGSSVLASDAALLRALDCVPVPGKTT